MRFNKKTFTILLVVLIIAAIQGVRSIRNSGIIGNIVVDQKSKGSLQAPIHIIEYTDFQCPACAKGAVTLKNFLKHYPDKIFVQYKPFPMTQLHEQGMICAVAGECAARQNKFWTYQDLLFEMAQPISRSLRVKGLLVELAGDSGLDKKQFEQCLNDPAVELGIMQEREKAQSLGVAATPTYFINGKMTVGAGIFMEEMQKLLGEKK